MVIPRFVQQALTGESITVHGDGNQSRCFCHVADVTKALVRLMETPAATGEIFNLGSDEEVTIMQLANVVKKLTGSMAPITLVPYEQAYAAGFEDMQRRVPDLTKIRKMIGFKPANNLEKIVSDVIAHARARLGLK
jgi:UDP-glucose 4-epimerase